MKSISPECELDPPIVTSHAGWGKTYTGAIITGAIIGWGALPTPACDEPLANGNLVIY